MRLQRDFGPTDIARQNADIWITVGGWLARLVPLLAVVCFAIGSAIGLHDHLAVSPDLWLRHLGAGYAGTSLRHLVVILSATFLGVMLESLVLCRNAFARGEAAAIVAVFTIARRLLLGARRTALPAISSSVARRQRVDDDEHGILDQLRSAMSIAPAAPPRLVTVYLDPSGSFPQSVIERRPF